MTLDNQSAVVTPIIRPTELKYIRQIGSGTFGDVYEGTCRKQRVAIKKLRGDVDEEYLSDFIHEIGLMAYVNARYR